MRIKVISQTEEPFPSIIENILNSDVNFIFDHIHKNNIEMMKCGVIEENFIPPKYRKNYRELIKFTKDKKRASDIYSKIICLGYESQNEFNLAYLQGFEIEIVINNLV